MGSTESNLIDIEGAGNSQMKTQMMLEEEQNLEQLQERERAVRQLEADITDVNQIFKDLAAMVHDQGEMVDSIEANVETSSIRVNEGAEQLRQAERWQVSINTLVSHDFFYFGFVLFRIKHGKRRLFLL